MLDLTPFFSGLDETATAVPVQLLRGADAGGEQTHSIGVRPMAQIKLGCGRKRVNPPRLLCRCAIRRHGRARPEIGKNRRLGDQNGCIG
jgi:hypothetical protein